MSLTDLTPRELDAAQLVAQGLSNREIGKRLGIAESTVKQYLNRVYEKTDSESRVQLAVKLQTHHY